jgi:UDP-glucuronate 4-epimerase
MKVLVTGAGGFIGFHLCNALAESKIDTFGLDNFNKYYDVNLKKNRIKILKKKNYFKFSNIDIFERININGSINVLANDENEIYA